MLAGHLVVPYSNVNLDVSPGVSDATYDAVRNSDEKDGCSRSWPARSRCHRWKDLRWQTTARIARLQRVFSEVGE